LLSGILALKIGLEFQMEFCSFRRITMTSSKSPMSEAPQIIPAPDEHWFTGALPLDPQGDLLTGLDTPQRMKGNEVG
jgi:hypothetical protein